MSQLCVTLFGKMSIAYQDDVITGKASGKAQELFSYLLLHRNRTHSRERLASLLWGDYCTTTQSKKYLRKALWQLQTALAAFPVFAKSGLLETKPEWIKLNEIDALNLDVATFERAYEMASGMSGKDLQKSHVKRIEKAIESYRGELLESWYYDWCLVERERLQDMYIRLLYKLLEYAEANKLVEKGISYGSEILKFDAAHEQTYRALMRIYHQSGDRTSAIRQYNRCVQVLEEELGISPEAETRNLFLRLKSGSSSSLRRAEPASDQHLDLMVNQFKQLQENLMLIQQQVENTMEQVEQKLSTWAETS